MVIFFIYIYILYIYTYFTKKQNQKYVYIYIYLFKDFIYLFLDKGGEREKERESKKSALVASRMPPAADLARNPDMCPDWELNHQPFGSQASAQSAEPHPPGLTDIF